MSRAQGNPGFWHTYPDRQHWPEDEREEADHAEWVAEMVAAGAVLDEWCGLEWDYPCSMTLTQLRREAFPPFPPSSTEPRLSVVIRQLCRNEYLERLGFEFDGPCTD